MMRLLDKRSVGVQVAVEKKRQIDEGVKLASKVDALRETKLKEEADLARFRTETVSRTQEAIDTKIREKDALDTQIRARKHELSELRKPLDKEWVEVNDERSELNKLQTILYEKKGELEQGIALNIRRERENEKEKQRIATERERSSEALLGAEKAKEEAKETLRKATTRADSITQNVQRRDETSGKREKAVEVREREVEKEGKRLKKIEKQQAEKDKEIKDKYETLNRDIERIHGKRGTRLK